MVSFQHNQKLIPALSLASSSFTSSIRKFSIHLLSSLLFLAGSFNVSFAIAEDRYISDRLYVPLRSGKGDQYRIVHKGLPSGTAVKLIESDAEAGYTLVETNKGVQGWVRSQYLLDSPTAAILLQQAEAKLGQYSSDQNSLANQNIALKEELQNTQQALEQTNTTLSALQKEHEQLQNLSANTVKINQKNKELMEQNQLLLSQVDGLEATKEKLSDNTSVRMFVFGGLLVILTLIANGILDGIKRRRSFSNW